MVLTGFDFKMDLARLRRDCHWKPPTYVTLVDAAMVFRALSGKSTNPNVATALKILGFTKYPTAPFHNAANDAWYALELLFRKAEQAQRQHEDPSGDSTIDWSLPPRTPPLSLDIAHSDEALEVAATSFYFDMGPLVLSQHLPAKPDLPTRPNLPPIPDFLPRLDLPYRPAITAGMPRLSQKPKRRRRSQRDGVTSETTGPTDAATAEDSRPRKRPKLMG